MIRDCIGLRWGVAIAMGLCAVLVSACGRTEPAPSGNGESRLARHVELNHDASRAAPCERMGSLHRDSRSNLENLRSCGELSFDEWSCMSTALQDIDRRYTAVCETRTVDYDEFRAEQASAYAACFEAENSTTMRKALDLNFGIVPCEED